jgi:hypothetical protein
MSGYFSFASAGVTVGTPAYNLDTIGLVNANGKGTTVTSGTSNNKGASWTSIGTSSVNWSGFIIKFNCSSSTRYLIDLSTNNSSANLVPDLLYVASAASINEIFIPVKIASGTTIYAKTQCTSASAVTNITIQGIPASESTFVGFTSMHKVLDPDTGTTRGNASVNAACSSTAPTFATAVASTTDTYDAFLVVPTGAALTMTAQEHIWDFAYGASDTVVARWPVFMNNSTTNDANRGQSPIIYQRVTTGQKLAYRVWAANNLQTGDSNLRAAIYGFKE